MCMQRLGELFISLTARSLSLSLSFYINIFHPISLSLSLTLSLSPCLSFALWTSCLQHYFPVTRGCDVTVGHLLFPSEHLRSANHGAGSEDVCARVHVRACTCYKVGDESVRRNDSSTRKNRPDSTFLARLCRWFSQTPDSLSLTLCSLCWVGRAVERVRSG